MKKTSAFYLAVFLNFYFSSYNVFAATTVTASPTEPQPPGTTVTQQTTLVNQSTALVDTQNTLMTLAATSTAPTLTATAASLYTAIKANTSYLGDMNLLYGNYF